MNDSSIQNGERERARAIYKLWHRLHDRSYDQLAITMTISATESTHRALARVIYSLYIIIYDNTDDK